jgi:hypothetical protein
VSPVRVRQEAPLGGEGNFAACFLTGCCNQSETFFTKSSKLMIS